MKNSVHAHHYHHHHHAEFISEARCILCPNSSKIFMRTRLIFLLPFRDTLHFFVQSEELKVCIGSLHVEAFFFSSLHCLICEKWICVTCAWYHIGSKIQPFSFSVFASQQEKMWNVVGRLLKTADNIIIHTGSLKRCF